MKIVVPFFALLLLVSCNKEEDLPEPTPGDFDNGVLVLNEGLFQQNNASISFYSNATSTSSFEVFKGVNNRGLGDTANDWVTFESNGSTFIAVAVDISSQIEIVSANKLTSITQIPLFDGATAREPRSIQIANGKIYAANFDGTVTVHNLYTFEEMKVIAVGQNPNSLAVSNGKLYVANSGGLNAPNYDSTVTVIDLTADTVLYEIDAAINMSAVITAPDNKIFARSSGNYSSVNPSIFRIDTQSDAILDTLNINMTAMKIYENELYYMDADLLGVYKMDLTSLTPSAQIVDLSAFNTPYAMDVHEGLIYVSDANNYVNSSIVRVYDMNGVYQKEFTAGLNANNFVFNE